MGGKQILLTLAVAVGSVWSVLGAEPGITVAAKQRYPWNGLVDLKFTITGTSGTKYDASFVAKDMVGGTNITMKTIRKSNGVAAAEKEQLLPGNYSWVWDAAADLPKDFVCDRVKVVGTAEQSQGLYMVIDLSSGNVTYLDSVPSGGWTSTPYKLTKMAFRRVEAGTFAQSSGGFSTSVRQCTITKPFYISVYPITKGHLETIDGLPLNGDAESKWYNWMELPPTDSSLAFVWPYDPFTSYVDLPTYKSEYIYDMVHMALRGTCGWPENGHAVVASSPIGKLRNKSKLSLLDLPTEAQLGLARSTVSLGGLFHCSLDLYNGDLGTTAVVDPIGWSKEDYYQAWQCTMHRVFLSQTRREAQPNSDYQIVVRLCLTLSE